MNNTAQSNAEFVHIGTRPVRPDGIPKVTGAARYGADFFPSGALCGRILRSVHPHARILSIDTSKAEALPGVMAVVTGSDFADLPFAYIGAPGLERNAWHGVRNVMAKEKVYYHGQAVAAVAAKDESTAKTAVALIDVQYEVLPFVISIDEALAPEAPLVHEDMYTRYVEPKPRNPSNVARLWHDSFGDVDAAFADSDLVVEDTFDCAAVHQGYIEPHACVAEYSADGHSTLWVSSQGIFAMRDQTALYTGMTQGDIRVTQAEIGGGFGGKLKVYLEPVAMLLSKKSGRPVKMTMSREEIFHATGPASDSKARVKIGAKKDGTLVGAEIDLVLNSGAFPSSPYIMACLCALGPYNIPNQRMMSRDIVSNRAMTAAYRAPGHPQINFAVEAVIDIVAQKLSIDPVDLRLKNVVHIGDKQIGGRVMTHEGMSEVLLALKEHPAYQRQLGPNKGRGIAAGYTPNSGGDSSATVVINSDGTVSVSTGSPDIGGSRASMALIAAEVFGVPYEKIRIEISDSALVPFTHVTAGSRVTFATGRVVADACERVVAQLKARAATIWGTEPEAVDWIDGEARPTSSNAGSFAPLTLADLAAKASTTGGHFGATHASNVTGWAPGFAAMFCDVEIDPETGKTTLLNFVTAVDAGRAVHPSYVEGQMQGGAAQGIGWALNEGYVYGADGKLQNAGWLDYRMPVASDLPMIDTVIVEVPNPDHPFGVKGVAEASIVSAAACVANAISNAAGRRMKSLPISPNKLLHELKVDAAVD